MIERNTDYEEVFDPYLLFEKLRRRYGSKRLNELLARELRVEFRPVEGALPFENGVLLWSELVRTGSLVQAIKPHSPDYFAINLVPWRIAIERLDGYEGPLPPQNERDLLALFERLAPKPYKAFRAWVETANEEKTLKNMVQLLEIIGYTFYPHGYPFKKAFILWGPGDSGKSTYLNLIAEIVGEGNYSALSYDQLVRGEFELAELFGKLVNITSIPPEKIREGDIDKLKKLTGDGEILARRKYQAPFLLRNYAKLIFGANFLPKIKSMDADFLNRWIIIEFPNTFPRNPRFFEETFTNEEIEGIIISAIYAFYLALKRGAFINNPNYSELMDAQNRKIGAVIKAFERLFDHKILERETPPIRHYILKEHLTELINNYLFTYYGYWRMDPRAIYRILKNYYPDLRKLESRPMIGDKQLRVINGIKILRCDKVEQIVGPVSYPPCNERGS